jgi:multidrug efflux pump subunit AcrA (membrane-fusion protein)
MAKVQAQAAAAQQKMTLDHQAEMASLNTKYQIELATAQLKAQGEREKAQNQAALQQHLNQLENERHQNEIAMESRMREFEANIQGLIDIRVAHINNAGKIAAAQVTAKASDGAEAEQRESSQE